MEAFYLTLALGSTVMMCMFAAVFSQKIEADRAGAANSRSAGDFDF